MREDLIRIECWNKAIHTLGTSYVFQKKAERLERRIRLITFLGVIVPISVGGIAMTYGIEGNILKWTLFIAGLVALLQLFLSTLSLVNKWDTIMLYALESQTENRILSEGFQQLGKFPPKDFQELNERYLVLSIKDSERTRQDEKIVFSDKEFRTGMRYALMILKRECEKCKLVPSSMSPSNCDICGNF